MLKDSLIIFLLFFYFIVFIFWLIWLHRSLRKGTNKKNIYPIKTNRPITKCSDDYTSTVKKYFKNKKIIFDYCLLGMGNDGHIASLFPNSKHLNLKFITKPVIRNDFFKNNNKFKCDK